MASTPTTSLKLQLIGNGDQSGTWGTSTNTNWNLIEQAVTGVQSITMVDANYTLSNINYTLDEARNLVLVVTGTNSAIRQIIAPLVPKFYIVTNNTTGATAITIGGTTGYTVAVPIGQTYQVYCDGTNFYPAQSGQGGGGGTGGFAAEQEIQTATDGQTVFTLSTITYVPNTNSLSVYVDGVNQYGPGSTYSFIETSSTVVTFNSGLHKNALVKFTTIQEINGAISSEYVIYTPAGTGAVTTTVQAKLRQTVSVMDFGAAGDGTTDDTTAVTNALNSGYSVSFPKGTYLLTSSITCTQSNISIFLMGSTLQFKPNYSAQSVCNFIFSGNNVIVDLGGGVISQGMTYAIVATNTTPGANTIVVTDASKLVVGQPIVSSWGTDAGSPLNGAISPYSFVISSISGNTITLNNNMNGSTAYLPATCRIGYFSFDYFIAVSGGGRVTFQNGQISDCMGYFYQALTSAIGSETVLFENINFLNNGTEAMIVRKKQTININNCQISKPLDVAKSGIWWDDTAYVHMSNTYAQLGNNDFAFVIAGRDETMAGGELYISECTFDGAPAMTPISGTYAQDVLNIVQMVGPGYFETINIVNSNFRNYARYFLFDGYTPITSSSEIKNIFLDSTNFSTCFSYLYRSGSGNGFNIPYSQISNCSFVQSLSGYVFNANNVASTAGISFNPQFSNCSFNLTSGSNQIAAPCFINNSTFISTVLNIANNTAQIEDCIFDENSSISVAYTSPLSVYGVLSNLIFKNAYFPTNLSSMFPGQGGNIPNGRLFCTAKSINGSVYYNVANLGGTLVVSGTFYKVNGTYGLEQNDYYIPIGSLIQDLYAGTIQKVTFNLPTTLSATASTSATSVTVASATGIANGDLLNILLDDGLVYTATVSSSSGTTITLAAGMPSQATNGAACNFFRVV